MADIERREHPRHKTEIGVYVYAEGQRISATITDISKRGLRLISQKRIKLGLKVNIRFFHTDDYAIRGTAEWALLKSTEGRWKYQTGIKADEVIDPEDIIKDSTSL